MATITGTVGDDVLIGTTGDDTYTGFFGGNDVVYDFGGYDTYIMDASFADFVDGDGGGDGYETIAFTGGQIVFYGAGFDGNGSWGEIEQIILNDFLFKRGTVGDDLMDYSAQAHAVNLESGEGNDTVIGSAFADELGGGDGSDLINGGDGDDLLYVDDGGDTVNGGAGFDTLELHSGGPESFSVMLMDPVAGSFIVQVDGNSESSSLVMSGVEMVVSSGGIARIGSTAADTLVGSDGFYERSQDSGWQISQADVLFGMGGNDSLSGGFGDDRLDGGAGLDALDGGDGNDTFVVDNAGDTLVDSNGYDTVMSSVSWTLAGGFEALMLVPGLSGLSATGNGLDNQLFGNERGNLLDGRGGNDFIEAGGGNDTLIGGIGADVMQGGFGNDVYYVDNAGDIVRDDGNGFDTVYSSISLQVGMLSGPYGGTWVSVEKVILQGTGNLTLEDSQTVEQWSAGRHLVGNSGTNALYGYSGDDTLDGGTGIDSLVGGTGNDTYVVDNAADAIVELAGEGLDAVFSSVGYTLAANVEYLVLSGTAVAGTGNASANTLLGNAGNNNLKGLGGADTLEGAGGNDTLDGGDGADYVSGGIGGDNLKGGTGNDVLNGGAGNDTLAGAAGSDLLIGGAGADRFLFNTATGASNVDHLQSFATASDIIQLDDAVFTGLTAGVLAAGRFALGTAAADSTDRIIYDAGTGSLYYDADGTGAGAQVLFAVIDDHAALVAADILVV